MKKLLEKLKARAITKGVLDEVELYLRGNFKSYEDLTTQHFKINDLYGVEVLKIGDDSRQSIKLPIVIITYDEEKLIFTQTPIHDKRVDKILEGLRN